jgi:uncharacterized protein YndB with AHSA1/START domain
MSCRCAPRTAPTPREAELPAFTKTVTIPRLPADVFPWLLEEDKVPQWTTRLQAYEVRGAVAQGTRIRQVLTVKGQSLDVELEITRYQPPAAAESRFSLQGIDVTTAYSLAARDGGTALTQRLEGRASGFKGRMLLPIVQGPLEEKIAEDLERLRELLT